MKCPICGKEYRTRELVTVRESWLRAGGWGSIPPEARVHVNCDRRELRRLEMGKVTLQELWPQGVRNGA